MKSAVLALALAALTFAPVTSARTTTLTKDQAFARASKCLRAHGADDVYSRAFNGGGLAQYRDATTSGTASFKYVVRGELAVGVQLWFSGSTGPTKLQKQWAQRCVSWGVPLLPIRR